MTSSKLRKVILLRCWLMTNPAVRVGDSSVSHDLVAPSLYILGDGDRFTLVVVTGVLPTGEDLLSISISAYAPRGTRYCKSG